MTTKENKSTKNINSFIESIGTVNRYSLLSRMQMDCEYFLGNGNKNEKHLWGLSTTDHIKFMKILWLKFPINSKPEWITMNDIINFQNSML